MKNEKQQEERAEEEEALVGRRRRRDFVFHQENVFLSGLDPRNTTKANKFKLKKQSQAPIDRVIPSASSSSSESIRHENMCSKVNFTFY